MPSQARFRVLAIEGRSCARHVSSYRIDARYRAAISPGVQQRPVNPAMVRSPARSLRLQFSERYTGQSTVPLPIAGQGSNRAEGPTRRRRRSRPLPGATGWPERSTSAPPRPAHGRHHPTAPARRRLVASRQPWALSVLPIRDGSSRTGRGPEQAPIRTSSTRLAGEPAHRSATRPGATAHRRTPEPLRRARHSARTARPEASAHDRTG